MNDKIKIWIVDDERIVRITLCDDLRDAGYEVREFSEAGAVLIALHEAVPEIIISDMKMPGIDGLELLNRIKEIAPAVIVLIMTAHGTTENAVKAMKSGAFDYILKPFQKDEMLMILLRALELKNIKAENKSLRRQIEATYDFTSFIGDTKLNAELFDTISLVAHKESTVLITGETGTGKELITNIVHYNSPRKNKPLVKVSCAILSREIFESELFGHVKGAFTGAESDKVGRFELADKGTLYLDDIDDIPLDLQVKLLRAIEQKEIEKVGSSRTLPVDIRLIASTKKDLRVMVAEGKFREDLFYRLNIFPLHLKPLRERKNDIPILLNHFIGKFLIGHPFTIEPDALNLLMNYHWPGNVRELKNIAERIAIFLKGSRIDISLIPQEVQLIVADDICRQIGSKPLDVLVADLEVRAIKLALVKSNNHKTKAAGFLGIPLSTLRTKMDKYGIE